MGPGVPTGVTEATRVHAALPARSRHHQKGRWPSGGYTRCDPPQRTAPEPAKNPWMRAAHKDERARPPDTRRKRTSRPRVSRKPTGRGRPAAQHVGQGPSAGGAFRTRQDQGCNGRTGDAGPLEHRRRCPFFAPDRRRPGRTGRGPTSGNRWTAEAGGRPLLGAHQSEGLGAAGAPCENRSFAARRWPRHATVGPPNTGHDGAGRRGAMDWASTRIRPKK